MSPPDFARIAERIESAGTWEDLPLPASERVRVREIVNRMKQNLKIEESSRQTTNFFADKGVTALFSGPRGTGKTIAAAVLANELDLTPYRVDLSSIVSRYIGETEKNLARLFEAAEEHSAVLFFDEADSLFGKRTDVRDAHDRYANLEMTYLMERVESYAGLVILTTNHKDNVDESFTRRFDYVINFPSLTASERDE